MTAIAEDLDLSWVTFTADDECCDGIGDELCGREAVAVAIWDAPCDHSPSQHRLCVAHRDYLIGLLAKSGGQMECVTCLAVWQLLRMEPIR